MSTDSKEVSCNEKEGCEEEEGAQAHYLTPWQQLFTLCRIYLLAVISVRGPGEGF